MSTLPAITASGLALVERADRRLAESARAFTRIADDAAPPRPPGDGAAAPPDGDAARAQAGDADLVDAVLGVVYGRTSFTTGVKLIAVGRDTEKMLVDVLA